MMKKPRNAPIRVTTNDTEVPTNAETGMKGTVQLSEDCGQ
jgi:hypothetical protein